MGGATTRGPRAVSTVSARSGGTAVTLEPTLDPLVVALAQLVRDRWAAGHGQRQKRVAFVRHPMNMTVMTTSRQPPAEASA